MTRAQLSQRLVWTEVRGAKRYKVEVFTNPPLLDENGDPIIPQPEREHVNTKPVKQNGKRIGIGLKSLFNGLGFEGNPYVIRVAARDSDNNLGVIREIEIVLGDDTLPAPVGLAIV
jgi:hypothetical protein